jgi:hypothetical protein
MRHHRQGSDLSPNEATPTKSEIERSVVIVRASMLLGLARTFAGLSAHDIRSIVCARFGLDIRTKSPAYIHGAFDTLVEQRPPLPRHDPTPA